jgi:hypothetical protein
MGCGELERTKGKFIHFGLDHEAIDVLWCGELEGTAMKFKTVMGDGGHDRGGGKE